MKLVRVLDNFKRNSRGERLPDFHLVRIPHGDAKRARPVGRCTPLSGILPRDAWKVS